MPKCLDLTIKFTLLPSAIALYFSLSLNRVNTCLSCERKRECGRREVLHITLQGLTGDIVSKLILAATAPTIDRVAALEEENRCSTKLHILRHLLPTSALYVHHICCPYLFHSVALQNAVSLSLQARQATINQVCTPCLQTTCS